MKCSQNKRANDLLVPFSALGSLRHGYSLLCFSNLLAARSQLLFSACDLGTHGNRNPGILQPLARCPLFFVSSRALGALQWGNGGTEADSLPSPFVGMSWDELEAVLDPGMSLPVGLVVTGIVTSLWMSPEEVWWSNHGSSTSRLGTFRLKNNIQSTSSPPYPLPTTPKFIRLLRKDNPGSSVGHGPAVMQGKGKEGI